MHMLENIKAGLLLSSTVATLVCRGGSRGGVTGVRTPPIHMIQ